MLTYLGTGERYYGKKPVRMMSRRFWEFQAVLEGKIAPILADGSPSLKSHCMWVFRPDCSHGWIGEAEGRAEIAVFHFRYVPEPLARIFNDMPFAAIPLSRGQCLRLRQLGQEGLRYWNQPAPAMTICYEHILMELSLMVCETLPGEGPANVKERNRLKVEQAITCYHENLEQNPSLQEISRKVGSSPAHLRRLFHDVLQTSPKEVFDQIRFQRVMQLMADTDLKLHAVADACGFNSPSAFSRAFKNRFGYSPDSWRS